MKANLMAWLLAVAGVDGMTAGALRVAVGIAHAYDKGTGSASPSIAGLATGLRMSENTARRGVKVLESVGCLVVERTAGRERCQYTPSNPPAGCRVQSAEVETDMPLSESDEPVLEGVFRVWERAHLGVLELTRARRMRYGECIDADWRELVEYYRLTPEELQTKLTSLRPKDRWPSQVDEICQDMPAKLLKPPPPPDPNWRAPGVQAS
jgi:hypothetical protein